MSINAQVSLMLEAVQNGAVEVNLPSQPLPPVTVSMEQQQHESILHVAAASIKDKMS